MNTTPRQARPTFWLRAIELRKHTLAHEYRRSLSDKAREGISDEDYATTMATLETMARNLGWDESDASELGPAGPRGRGFGRRHGFARSHHGHRSHWDHRGHGFGDRPFPNDAAQA